LGDLSCLHRDLIVYDLIYNPPETRLLKGAKERGAQAMNGLDMLIYQALEALRLWVGKRPFPVGLVRRVRAHLTRELMQNM